MFNVANYFKKFTTLEEGTKQTRGTVQQAFKEICGIDNVDFDLKKGIIYLKGNSMLKSAVFMKKTALVERFSKTDAKLRITDIR